jgi:hypothetical protein
LRVFILIWILVIVKMFDCIGLIDSQDLSFMILVYLYYIQLIVAESVFRGYAHQYVFNGFTGKFVCVLCGLDMVWNVPRSLLKILDSKKLPEDNNL